MEALSQLALELTGDAAVAERLVAEVKARAADEAEQRRLLAELAEAERREQAARRIARWKALQPKAAMVVVPVVVAFAVGLVLGGGLGMVRIGKTEPMTLVPNGPMLESSFGNTGAVDFSTAGEKRFTFELDGRAPVAGLLRFDGEGSVLLRANGRTLGLQVGDGADVVLRPSTLRAGKNELVFGSGNGGIWRVQNLQLELIKLPGLDAHALSTAAQEALDRADAYDRAGKPAGNYLALLELQNAWVLVESTETPKGGLYRKVRERYRTAQTQVESACRRLLADIRTAQPPVAAMALEELRKEFPSDAWCGLEGEKLAKQRGL